MIGNYWVSFEQLLVVPRPYWQLLATTGNYWRCPAPRFCETAHLTGGAGASEAAFGRALAILLSEIAYLAQMEKVRKCTSGKEFSSKAWFVLDTASTYAAADSMAFRFLVKY